MYESKTSFVYNPDLFSAVQFENKKAVGLLLNRNVDIHKVTTATGRFNRIDRLLRTVQVQSATTAGLKK